MTSMTKRKYLYELEKVGGVREVDYLSGNLSELPDIRSIGKVTITSSTENRLDLISNRFYGSYHYGWLIAEHNNILNPITGVSVGMVLSIPSIEEYYKFFNRNSRKVRNE